MKSVAEIESIANRIRLDIIEMLVEAGSGHSGGPLGMADVFATLYFRVLNHDPKNPDWPERDRVVLSNGHIVPVRYATMARAGYFPVEELMTLRKFGSRLQGHPERVKLPGLETTSGPLGCGLSAASGMALVLKMEQKKSQRIYCLVSDGEFDEGNIWEAVLFAGNYHLNQITMIMDRNNIQIDGSTEEVMPLGDVAEKMRTFGWHTIDVDGHNIQSLIDACEKAKTVEDKPTAIIAHTVPGKGVDYMEYDYHWHGNPPGTLDVPGSPPKAKQVEAALEQLRALEKRIKENEDD